MSNPKLLSLLLPLAEDNNSSFIAKALRQRQSSGNIDSDVMKIDRNILGGVFDCLNITTTTNHHHNQSPSNTNSSANTTASTSTNTSTGCYPCMYSVAGGPYLNNPMGKMHGGAIAMAVEKSVSMQQCAAFGSKGYLLAAIDLRYLNSVKVHRSLF